MKRRKLLTFLLLTSVSAPAGDTRRIVISIPDHKLALLEGERVIRVCDVATGKPTPSPAGEFRIVNRVRHPTWYERNPRHQRSAVRRQVRIARVHSHADRRRGGAFRAGAGGRHGGACRLKTGKGDDHVIPQIPVERDWNRAEAKASRALRTRCSGKRPCAWPWPDAPRCWRA
jgi:L,D-transpeptidase catalytic domain